MSIGKAIAISAIWIALMTIGIVVAIVAKGFLPILMPLGVLALIATFAVTHNKEE